MLEISSLSDDYYKEDGWEFPTADFLDFFFG